MRRIIIATAAVAALVALGAAPAFASRLGPASPGQARQSAQSAPHVTVSGFHVVQVPQVKRQLMTHPDAAKTRNSINWSGYTTLPKHGHKFKSISANFTVPAVNCANSTDGTNGIASMSNWVGLDGFSDATVEQTGEAAICEGSSLEGGGYLVFWETYPAPANIFCCTNAGDAIHVSVTFNSKTHLYHLFLDDYTIKATLSEFVACETGSTCHNSSAEVIGEDLDGGPPGTNLADFGQTSFVNASVTSSNGKSGSMNPGRYWSTDKIVMKNKKSLMALPGSLEGGRAFLDVWHNEK